MNRCLQQVWLAELGPSGAEVVPSNWALAPTCSPAAGAPKICAGGCDAATHSCKCTSDAQCKFGAGAGTQTATCDAGHCVNSTVLQIPAGWSGRFWPRTKCSGASGDFTCETGQCGDPGNIDCTTANKSANRATLFEITTGGTNGLDNYDVSLVSGYNVPVKVMPILPGDAPTWQKNSPFADEALITQAIGPNSFIFNNIGSAGTSGNTKPSFPATRFATVTDGPSIIWNNNGPSCETTGCTSDLRATCPNALRVKSGAATIACDSPADACPNGGSAGCSTNAMYYACNNYAGTQDLFGNFLTLQSPNGDSPVCFSAKDCQPGTTCLMNPTFVQELNPPLPTGAGVCTPVIQNGGCTPGHEGSACAAFPFVGYTCNTIQLSPTSTTAVCMPPTVSGAGDVVWSTNVWSATATSCTAGGGECTGAQQKCLDSNIVGNGQKECSASSGSCFCNNPDPCSAGRGTNDGCSQPDSCLNSDGVADGKSDNGSTVDCSSTTCYCAPQAIYTGACGPTNAGWLSAAKYPGVARAGIGYEKYFKAACPTSYAYQFDDASSDWTCNNTADQLVDYKVVFCRAP